MSRHIYIPDTQVRKGVPTDHLPWIGRYVTAMKPDVVVLAADWFDMKSLSAHDGAKAKEGARYRDDIESGNAALEQLFGPIHAEQARLERRHQKRWKLRKVATLGNHEQRIERFLEQHPVLEGTIGYKDFKFAEHGVEVHDFNRPVVIDGIAYSHFFYGPNTGRAYGGTAANILGKLGHSFTQGHRQVFDYATRLCPITGLERIGLIAGACYLHSEPYLGHQANSHWRGIVVKNEVRDGSYDIMRVSLDYLCRRYEGKPLRAYLESKYKGQDWTHIR